MRSNRAKPVVSSFLKPENTSLGYFGVELDSEAPIIVCDCISFLRHRGLQEVGIFRIPGNNDVVNELKGKYNITFSGKESKESDESSILNDHLPPPDISDVASLLKAYFKELERPLIPEEVTNELIAVVVAKGERALDDITFARTMSMVLARMPKPNYQCLSFLISFLREISVFRKYNNMGPDNLATCFVLSILGHGTSVNQMKVMGVGALVLRYLIELPIKLSMPKLSVVQNNTKFSTRIFYEKLKVEEIKKKKISAMATTKRKGKSQNGTMRGINWERKLSQNRERRIGTNREKKSKTDMVYKKNGTRMVKRPILLADVVGAPEVNEIDRTFRLSNYEDKEEEQELLKNLPPPPFDPKTMV